MCHHIKQILQVIKSVPTSVGFHSHGRPGGVTLVDQRVKDGFRKYACNFLKKMVLLTTMYLMFRKKGHHFLICSNM